MVKNDSKKKIKTKKSLKFSKKIKKSLKKVGGSDTDIGKLKKIWEKSEFKSDIIEPKYIGPLSKDKIWAVRKEEPKSEFNVEAKEFVPISNRPTTPISLSLLATPPGSKRNSPIVNPFSYSPTLYNESRPSRPPRRRGRKSRGRNSPQTLSEFLGN